MTTTEIFTVLLSSIDRWVECGLPRYAFKTFSEQPQPKHSAMARMLRRAGFKEVTPFRWIVRFKMYQEATWEK